MWQSGECCTFKTSWTINHDLNNIATYTVVECGDTRKADSTESTGNHQLAKTPITCVGAETSFLEIKCVTKPHAFSVIGINVVSEARTLELYSDLDGYLLSFQGRKLLLEEQDKLSDNVIDDSDVKLFDTQMLYECPIKFDFPQDNITIKFMGLENKSRLSIYRLNIFMILNEKKSTHKSQLIDMSKVKSYLDCMGDSLPQGALNMMNAVEQYQKSQKSSLDHFSEMLAPMLLSNKGEPDLLSNLLTSTTSNTKVSRDLNPQDTNSSTLKNSSGYLQDMFAAIQTSQLRNGDSDAQQDGGMFNILRTICGKVSSLRMSDTKTAERDEQNLNPSTGEKDSAQSAHRDTNVSVHPMIGTVAHPQQALEQTVSHLIQACEERLKTYIDTSLNAMEDRITKKLETLILACQKDGR